MFQIVTRPQADFQVMIRTVPGGSAATVTAGQTATYGLSVSGTNGFSGTVNFSCSGAPSNSSCSVSPNPLNVTGKSAVGVTVSVVTQANAVPVGLFYWPKSLVPNYYLAGVAIALALLISLALAQPAARFRHGYGYLGAVAIAGDALEKSTSPVTDQELSTRHIALRQCNAA